MRIATIHGYATSTVKHRSLEGWRLLLAVPESPDLAPQIVLDSLGAAIGQQVLISSDGSEARKIVKDERSPARWTVMGIIDPERSLNVG
jgi:ethanolamine utilization protein EutN